MLPLWKPHAVSLSSGGALLIGHLGVLCSLSESGILSDVTDWWGCSAGALAAYIGAMGVTPSWIRELVEIINFKHCARVDAENLLNYAGVWGLNNGDVLVEYIGRIAETWMIGSAKWTFADLHKSTGKNLHITATNISRCCIAEFSFDKTPNMLIMDALRASCAIPGFFTPWRDLQSGDIYCDGGVCEFFPWRLIPNKEKTLVISVKYSGLAVQRHPKKIDSVSDYFKAVYDTVNVNIFPPPPKHWIALRQKQFASFDFSMDSTDKRALFDMGFSGGIGWLKWRTSVSEAMPSKQQQFFLRNTLSGAYRVSKVETSAHPLPHNPSDQLPRQNSQGQQSPQRNRRWSL